MERRRRRVEADVAGDRLARSRVAPASPGVVAWRMPRHSSSASRPPSPAGPGRAVALVTGDPAQVVSTHREAADRWFTPPMLSCGHRCRPASRGASATDGRSGGDPRGTQRNDRRHGPSAPSSSSSSSPRSSWPVVGLLVVVGAYNHYAAGLPDPDGRCSTRSSSSSRRSSTTGPARSSWRASATSSASSSTFDEHPAARSSTRRPRSRTRTSGRTRASTRSASSRPASTRSAAGRAAPRRSPSSSSGQRLLPPSAFEGSTYERKIREIIQSIRLTEAFPGEEGKQQIITAYLNQNFYGNQSYGVKAAAKSYFGKSLDELTLAQEAILAAIPQSPTRFDLVRNAESVCLEDVAEGAECTKFKLVVPPDSEIVQRRNHILDLMKTRSPLTGDKHTAAEYDAAKDEPVELVQQVSATWKAPHFVWQVRRAARRDLLPRHARTTAPRSTRGGLQRHDDPRLEHAEDRREVGLRRGASAERQGPDEPSSTPARSRSRPRAGSSACAATTSTTPPPAVDGLPDRRDPGLRRQRQLHVQGQPRSSSRSSTSWPTAGASPGSAIKPIDYLIGIDDKTLTASTMLMDVVTDFGKRRTRRPRPTSSSAARSGSAPRSSSRSTSRPSRRAIITGLDRVFDADEGLRARLPEHGRPGRLDGHRHARDPPDRPARRVRHDRRRRRPRAATPDRPRSSTPTATQVRPATPAPEGHPGGQHRRGLHHHRHPGRQHRQEGQPVLGQVGDLRRQDPPARPPTRPAPPATTATWPPTASSRRRPTRRTPALAVGVWMGNSDNSPNDGKLSLDTSAPLWSAILTEISKGLPIADFHPPRRPRDGRGRRVHRAQARAVHDEDRSRSSSCRAPSRPRRRRSGSRSHIDEATGLLWQDGCAGPEVTQGFFDLTEVEADFPRLAEGQRRLGRAGGQGRRASGAARRGPGRRTSTTTRSRRSGGPGARRSPRPSCARSSRRRSAIRSSGRRPERPVRDSDPFATPCPPPSARHRRRPVPERPVP